MKFECLGRCLLFNKTAKLTPCPLFLLLLTLATYSTSRLLQYPLIATSSTLGLHCIASILLRQPFETSAHNHTISSWLQICRRTRMELCQSAYHIDLYCVNMYLLFQIQSQNSPLRLIHYSIAGRRVYIYYSITGRLWFSAIIDFVCFIDVEHFVLHSFDIVDWLMWYVTYRVSVLIDVLCCILCILH